MDRCPTCKRRHKRTNPANAMYWALLHAISEGVTPSGNQHSADTWHLWAKQKWLGADDVTLPTGKTLTIPHSTANLSVDEFNAYLSQVEAWAAERGVFLADLAA